MFQFFALLAFCSLSFATDSEREPIVLNDENFEHLTQAATGATTGDWIVLFAKTNTEFGGLEAIRIFHKIHLKMKRKLNVAIVDAEKNKGLIRRFEIQKLPNVHLFRLGFQYNYLGRVTEDKIRDFIHGGYIDYKKEPVREPIGFFESWKEQAIENLLESIKQRKLPSSSNLVIFMILFIGSLLFLLHCCSGNTEIENHTKKNE